MSIDELGVDEWDEDLDELEEEIEQIELNREQRNQLEPVGRALEYTLESLESEEEYFDPIHAARLRDSDFDSEPMSDIVNFDFQELDAVADRLASGSLTLRLADRIGSASEELEDHLSNANTISDHFNVDLGDMSKMVEIVSGEKEITDLRDAILEFEENGENIDSYNFNWAEKSTASVIPYDFLALNQKMAIFEGKTMDESEGIISANGVYEFLETIGFQYHSDKLVPPEPEEAGFQILDQLVDEYRDKIESMAPEETENIERGRRIQTTLRTVDWNEFGKEYGSVPDAEMRDFYETALVYHDEDVEIDSELLGKVVADVNGHDFNSNEDDTEKVYDPKEKVLADNFDKLKKAVSEVESLDYELPVPVMGKERELQRMAETIQNAHEFYQKERQEIEV